MSVSIPPALVAGDSFRATLDARTFAPSAGWTAQLVLIGATRLVIPAATSGGDHVVSADASNTAVWPPGTYRAIAVYTRGPDRQSVDAGSVDVQPDPIAVGTSARSLMTDAERALTDLEAAWRAYTSNGQFTVGEYQVAGRVMKYRSVDELLRALNAARRDVTAERAAKRTAAGLSPRTTYVTRM